jgi:hypothetical protein
MVSNSIFTARSGRHLARRKGRHLAARTNLEHDNQAIGQAAGQDARPYGRQDAFRYAGFQVSEGFYFAPGGFRLHLG